MGVSPKWTVAALGGRGSGGSDNIDKEHDAEEQQGRQHQEEEQELRQQPRRDDSGVATASAAEQQKESTWWLDVEASALAVATTSVAVMAPALTEGGPQKPENLLPVLPAGGFLTAEQAKQVCLSASVHPSKASNTNDNPTICKNREVLAQFVVSANVQPSKIDEQCLQGIPKNLIEDVINLKFGSGLDGLSDLIAVGTSRKESAAVAREAINGVDAIMSDISMGDDDPVDSMCYFRTNMGPSSGGDSQKDELCRITDVAEDAINLPQAVNDGADVAATSVNDTSVTDEDRQIAEEIMGFPDINVPTDLLRGIMSLNSVSSQEMLSGDSRLIDGCGGLLENVMPSQSASDEVPPEIFDNEAFTLNLLNDVDVMGLMGNDNISDNGVIVDQHHNQQQQLLMQAHQLQQQETTKLAELSRHRVEIEKRQYELERKAAHLLRRLRKFQSQLVGRHAAEEAGHILELSQKSAKKFLNQDLANLGQRAGGNARAFPEIGGNISSFLQKVQKSCTAQNSVAVRNKNTCRYFGAGSRDNYVNSNANRAPAFGVPQIRIDGEQVEQVAGPLATKLKIVQNAYDSDCTASSSGGESCDEMQTFNNPHQQRLPILKRASWRWAQDRASVAARWTWLQAQISDLEFRIRQHSELQRQIRSTKGNVILEAPAPTPSTSSINATGAGSSYGPEPTMNGYSTTATTGRTCGFEGGLEPGNLGSSRCRPYVRHLFRKRKLVQLDGLHLYSKKAARPTNIRCNCDGRLACCALCTGRRDPTVGQDTELMSVQERLALIDPGFHPVLSMPDEVTVPAHADAILRNPEWQQKMARGGVRGSKMKDKDGNERRNKRSAEQRSKNSSRLKKPQTSLTNTSKRSRNNSERPNTSNSRKRPTKQAQQQQQQQSQSQPQSQQQQQAQSSLPSQQLQLSTSFLDEEEEVASALSSSSKYSSPVPSPLLLHQHSSSGSTSTVATPTASVPPFNEKNTLKEKSSNSHSYSRLRQNSYDIDNIVIPYSVAATTRLEKLTYKEIIIPKWRMCSVPPSSDVKNGAVQKSLADSDVEDVSDDAVVQRHERSERDEAKRFMNFMHLPYQSRMRRDRRPECRFESGANTPDPMSPHASECGNDTSPVTSPPPTPGNVNDSEQSDSQQRSSSLQNALRRKMSTRSQKEETSSSFIEEEQEQVLPYEPRDFPLTDEDYSEMKKEMPFEEPVESFLAPLYQQNDIREDEAELYSHESDSTESALCDFEGEDPNDPEWTMSEVKEAEKERIRSTVKR